MSMNFVEDVAPGPNSGLIEVLSYRTYPSLVSALREVVSNASDADASKLNISLSRNYDAQLNKVVWKLTFFDDGEGMTLDEFKNYLRLSGLGRRDRTASDATASGRPIIGMLGIGSLAIAPWADRVEILTKKRSSVQVLHVQVPYAKFFNNADIRTTDLYGNSGEYKYKQRTFELQNPETSDVENGFTIIDLIDLTDEAINELIDPAWSQQGEGYDLGLLGDKYQDYLASTKNRGRLSFSKFPPLLRFMHRLALLIPVSYPSLTPVQNPPIRAMVETMSAQCMKTITVQGVQLQRPMLILDQQTEADKSKRLGQPVKASSPSNNNPPQGVVITINETLPNSGVQIRGYIWGQNTQIKFQDLAGIQVRIKNVGIGSYNFALFDLAHEGDNRSSTRPARAQAISGEIFIDYSKELERALRGDREGFQESSPVYLELKTAVYKHIQKMYQKIDALAPSRQTPKPKKPTQTSTGQEETFSDNNLLPTNLDENQGQARLEVDATPVIAIKIAAEHNNNGNTNSEQKSAPKMISIGEGLGRTLKSSDLAITTVVISQTDVIETRPNSQDELFLAFPRLYKLSRDMQMPLDFEITDLTETNISAHEIVVKVRSDLLPPDLPKDKLDQVCIVAAALALSKAAKENQIALTEIGAALALQFEEKELNNA